MVTDQPKSFSELLQVYAPLTAPAGVADGIDKAQLERQLSDLQRYLVRHYYVMVIALLVIFIVGIAVVLLFIHNPKNATAVIAGLGISAGGAITRLDKLGKDVARLRLLAALCSAMSQEQIGQIVQVLSRRIQ